jgi:hypothetical protein
MLAEQLEQLSCPPELIFRIQYTAGKLSFGRDPWIITEQMLAGYKDNKLDFVQDTDNLN